MPRTDNLYQPVRNTTTNALDFTTVVPETTKSYDLGYRFRNERIIGSVAAWYIEYNDRIVSSFDNDINSPTFGISIDRNVGQVKQQGVDAQLGYVLNDQWTFNTSASWNDSELQDDLALSATTFLPTKGKKLVETPEWTYSARVDWDPTDAFHVGLQAKYVGERFSTDVNDETSPSYVVADMDVRYDLQKHLDPRRLCSAERDQPVRRRLPGQHLDRQQCLAGGGGRRCHALWPAAHFLAGRAAHRPNDGWLEVLRLSQTETTKGGPFAGRPFSWPTLKSGALGAIWRGSEFGPS